LKIPDGVGFDPAEGAVADGDPDWHLQHPSNRRMTGFMHAVDWSWALRRLDQNQEPKRSPSPLMTLGKHPRAGLRRALDGAH
jgi:hypothetical protein